MHMTLKGLRTLVAMVDQQREIAANESLAPGEPGWIARQIHAQLDVTFIALRQTLTRMEGAAEDWAQRVREQEADPSAQASRVLAHAALPEVALSRELAARMHGGQTLPDGTSLFEYLRQVQAGAYRAGLAIGLEAVDLRCLEHLALLGRALGTTELERADLTTLGYPDALVEQIAWLGQWHLTGMTGDDPGRNMLLALSARASADALIARAGGLPPELITQARLVLDMFPMRDHTPSHD
jgi:hypothetical protein